MLKASELIVITREQKRDGYLLRIGHTVIELDYKIISVLRDGTYLATHGHKVI